MKFRAERDVLVDGLAVVSRAATTRGGAHSALSGIRMEATLGRLHLAATDLDLTIEVYMEVFTAEPGVCVLPARLILDIIKSLEPGAVSVHTEESEAIVTAGRSQFSVRVLATEEFLRLPQAPGESVTLSAPALVAALQQVVPAASRDESRPILTGVLMESEGDGIRLVATDSYRLALRDLPGTDVLGPGQRVLVPSRALGELTRLLGGAGEVSLWLGADEAGVTVGQTRLTTRLLEGDFPDYRKLIPTSHANRLTVSREALLDALRRVKLLARDAAPVRLTFNADGVSLSAVTQDVGQANEDVDAKYEGSDMTVAFNPEFLIDGLEAVTGEEVELDSVDALKPATIRPAGGAGSDHLYLLMPVRVS